MKKQQRPQLIGKHSSKGDILRHAERLERDLNVAALTIAAALEGADITKPIPLEVLQKAPLHLLRGNQIEVEGAKYFEFKLAFQVGVPLEANPVPAGPIGVSGEEPIQLPAQDA